MTFSDNSDEPFLHQRLYTNFRTCRAHDTDVEINTPIAQRAGAFLDLIRKTLALIHKTQRRQRCAIFHRSKQTNAEDTRHVVACAHDEAALQRRWVDIAFRPQEGLRTLDQFMHAALQLQRTRCRNQTSPGTHQNGISEPVTDAGKLPAHRRRTEIHTLRRTRDASFRQKGVEGDQKVHVKRGD